MGLVHLQRRLGIAACAVVAAVAFSAPATAPADVTNFAPNGAEQTFVVPAGVTSVHAIAIGGHGGQGEEGGPGGFGAIVSADLAVTPGQTLYIEVGGNGKNGAEGGAGGFNGGGAGGAGGYTEGGGGGGATDIRIAPRALGVSLVQRLLVAGGGGGSGGAKCSPTEIGYGGTAGLMATAGGASCGGAGQPGTSSEGGEGATGCGEGIATDGQLGAGGPGEWDHGCLGPGGSGGGGGGGLYGGGGGGSSSAGGGGGAGSSGFGPGATNTTIGTDVTGSPSVLLTYTVTLTGDGGPSGGGSSNVPGPSSPGPTPSSPGPQVVCKVPNLVGKKLKAAKKALANSNCKLGTVKRRSSGSHTVTGQGPKAGKTRPSGTSVSVTLGGGSRHGH